MMAASSQAARLIDAVIGAGPAQMLRAAGFRKAGHGFHRVAGSLFQVVHFQASRWNTPLIAQFTVNLNIVQPFFHEKWSGRAFPTNPSIAAPVLSQRVGMLMPAGLDHWWELSANSDVNSTGAEVTELVADLGLPFLTDHADVGQLILKLGDEPGARIRPLQGLYRAILLASRGDTAMAIEAIREVAKANKVIAFAETIKVVSSRLGFLEAAEPGAAADRVNGAGLPEL